MLTGYQLLLSLNVILLSLRLMHFLSVSKRFGVHIRMHMHMYMHIRIRIRIHIRIRIRIRILCLFRIPTPHPYCSVCGC